MLRRSNLSKDNKNNLELRIMTAKLAVHVSEEKQWKVNWKLMELLNINDIIIRRKKEQPLITANETLIGS